MKYMLLIYGDESALNESARQECYEESRQLAHELKAAGQYLGASPLRLTDTATSVRVRAGRKVITDGPFAKTREQLGGYYLVDTQNLDEALTIAAKIPAARWGTVEVRPVIELPDMPELTSDSNT